MRKHSNYKEAFYLDLFYCLNEDKGKDRCLRQCQLCADIEDDADEEGFPDDDKNFGDKLKTTQNEPSRGTLDSNPHSR